MTDTIKFKKISEEELRSLQNRATSLPFSQFARFCLDSVGYRYKSRTGYDLDKWEVFNMGYTDANAIISGQTPIRAFKKVVGGAV
jgi:hypothetical protein